MGKKLSSDRRSTTTRTWACRGGGNLRVASVITDRAGCVERVCFVERLRGGGRKAIAKLEAGAQGAS